MSAGAAPPWIESQLPVRGELALADILRVLEPQVRGVSFRIVSIVGAAGYPPEEMAAAVAEGRLLTAEELAAGAPARGYVEWMTVVGAYDRAVLSGRPTLADAVARADLLLFSNDGDPWTVWTRDPVAARAVARLGGPDGTMRVGEGFGLRPPLWGFEATWG